MSDGKDKKEVSETLNYYLGDQDIPTNVIAPTKEFAFRRFGRRIGMRIVNALERLERKKAARKAVPE